MAAASCDLKIRFRKPIYWVPLIVCARLLVRLRADALALRLVNFGLGRVSIKIGSQRAQRIGSSLARDMLAACLEEQPPMPWEYLNTYEFDARFFPIAGRILGTFGDRARILHLNCGMARLARVLRGRWGCYVCNDLHQRPAQDPKIYDPNLLEFHAITDGAMYARLKAQAEQPAAHGFDVLVWSGIASGRCRDPEWESISVVETFPLLVELLKPRLVCLETSADYERRFGILASFTEPPQAKCLHPYSLTARTTIKCADIPHGTRHVAILELPAQ